jgi:hypothetical protein
VIIHDQELSSVRHNPTWHGSLAVLGNR